MFHSLHQAQIAKIVELQLLRVFRRLKEQRGIHVEISDSAKKLIAEKGYEPSYGARPLKRVIQQLILDPLALKVITGEISDGSRVSLGAKNGEVTIRGDKKALKSPALAV